MRSGAKFRVTAQEVHTRIRSFRAPDFVETQQHFRSEGRDVLTGESRQRRRGGLRRPGLRGALAFGRCRHTGIDLIDHRPGIERRQLAFPRDVERSSGAFPQHPAETGSIAKFFPQLTACSCRCTGIYLNSHLYTHR